MSVLSPSGAVADASERCLSHANGWAKEERRPNSKRYPGHPDYFDGILRQRAACQVDEKSGSERSVAMLKSSVRARQQMSLQGLS